jgi:hypothetical protein
LTDVKSETDGEEKLLDPSQLAQSQNSSLRNSTELQAPQNSATKNDTFEVRKNGVTILEATEEVSPIRDAASVPCSGINIEGSTIGVHNPENTNVTVTEHAELGRYRYIS